MTTNNKNWNYFFLGFAIVTIISGLYLIFQKDYVIGICGTITGFFLIYMSRVSKPQDQNNESV